MTRQRDFLQDHYGSLREDHAKTLERHMRDCDLVKHELTACTLRTDTEKNITKAHAADLLQRNKKLFRTYPL